MKLLRTLPPIPAVIAAGLLHAGASPLSAADETTEKLTFNTTWRGERIELPPRFAPTMTLKGIEEIRFAPGMFKAESDWFFSYVFVSPCRRTGTVPGCHPA